MLAGRTHTSKAGRTRPRDEKMSRQMRKMRAELRRKLWACHGSQGPAWLSPPARVAGSRKHE